MLASLLLLILFFHFRVVLDAVLPPHGSTMCGILIAGRVSSSSDSLSSVTGLVASVQLSSHPLSSAMGAGFAAHPLSMVVLDAT